MTGALDVAVSILEFLAVVAIVLFIGRRVFTRRGRTHIGPAASGTVYELLNEDKRKAVELIVEERTGERDPEDRDGSFDDLDPPDDGQRMATHPK
jgi:hypothetical protein